MIVSHKNMQHVGTDHTLLASRTGYPFLHAEGNTLVFALFAVQADDSFDENISNYLSLNYYFMTKMLNLE